ncbi:DNA-binding transcriptional regulator, MarR family [Ralstonia sp. 25mfcol4.1]|uniref:MarR family winged helix-turn-helix transcriptional regulator n=1 Tax=Burkholderiaceae TaxID=119060 RepID=UPI00087E9029|nr:MarR family transcriptional regulator [Ralstonia sp. 25mfcol4.1]SDP05402.1 DNA-binding transcriptional regulator, MarR family [Ralstonia sp. 25mfcol4.1]
MSSTTQHTPATTEGIDPWSHLDEAGTGLNVNDFLTTMLSQLVTALRSSVTEPYATQFDLTVPEWRILALLAHGEPMSFAELVKQSTSDKALVSRTLRLLEDRGLVTLESQGTTPRKRLSCKISEAGAALHAQVIPLARRGQASVIRLLTPEERHGLYAGLRKLHGICTGAGKA